jgi:hypothetical protein
MADTVAAGGNRLATGGKPGGNLCLRPDQS